jgi:hypothetical protein
VIETDVPDRTPTVARWEKGKAKLPGPADLALRALFLASDTAQPEGSKILSQWKETVIRLIERDQLATEDLLFNKSGKVWRSQRRAA